MLLIDTNVLAYLLIEGERSADAQKLSRLDPDWRSEAFIFVEFTNVLVRSEALAVAAEHRVTAYDARFLTLARHLRVKLVTEDARLRAAAPNLTQSLAEAARSG